MILTTKTAPHYTWGDGCDGWRLCYTPDLSVIRERMPAGTSEIPHLHRKALQVFFILNGTALIQTGSDTLILAAGDSVCIEPGTVHSIRNPGQGDLEFMVTSVPNTRGDRTDHL